MFYSIIKTDKNTFAFLFNFFSFLNKSKNRIRFRQNYYYNTEIDWRFFHKKQGLYAYGNGFEKRKKELRLVYLIDQINFKKNDVILDIGANNGDFYLCFNNNIDYYGYEPSPIVFSNLKYNIKNQNVYNLALSNDINKNIDFYLSDEFGDSSILPIKNYTKKITINTTTLDNEINRISKKIKLIKLEAEGFEPEILQGLINNFHNVEYITIDCGFERGINQESTLAECSNYLIKNKFKMINFGGSPRMVCLFKNSRNLNL